MTTENEWVTKVEQAQDSTFRAQRSVGGAIEIASSPAGLETPAIGARANASLAGPTPKPLRLISPQEAAANSKTIADQSFWESPEAAKLFRPKDDDNTVEETLTRRIKTLSAAVATSEGWRAVVEGRDPDDVCTDSDINAIRQRCMLLCQAYLAAMKRLGRGEGKHTWKMCCVEACTTLNFLGVVQATNPTSTERYNLACRSDETFPHPNQFANLGKKPDPQMFQVYPELKERIERFCTANVATLSVESLCNFVHGTLMPETHALFLADLPPTAPDEVRTLEHFCHCFNLKNLSFTTVWRWMKHIGFTYDRRKKSFHVDGHERSDVVSERKTFCKTYLMELEPKCKRWI